jgi:hypothetical protein
LPSQATRILLTIKRYKNTYGTTRGLVARYNRNPLKRHDHEGELASSDLAWWLHIAPVIMTNTNRIEPLYLSVLFAAEEVAFDLRDRCPYSIALFGARDQFTYFAWAFSLRALSNAHQASQEYKLKGVGTALLVDIDQQFKVFVEQQEQTIGAVLTRFFDPKDDLGTQRLSAFADIQGVLAGQFLNFLGPQGRVLAKTLASLAGETSQFFKNLSPTYSSVFGAELVGSLEMLRPIRQRRARLVGRSRSVHGCLPSRGGAARRRSHHAL